MKRAFQHVRLSLGLYQRVIAEPYDADGEPNLSDSGKAPRLLSITVIGSEFFEQNKVALLLTEQAQRDLIALLNANLEDRAALDELVSIARAEPYSEVAL